MQFVEICKKIEELIASCKILGNPAGEKTLSMWHEFVQFVKGVGESVLTTSDHFLIYEDKVSKVLKILVDFLEREQFLLQEFGQTLMLGDRLADPDPDTEIEEDGMVESPASPMVGQKRKGHVVFDSYPKKK